MKPLRVLLVEDDRLAADAFRARLVALGHRVEHVLTGAEGLDHAFAHRPDLVLLDVCLGEGLDGIETAAALRRALDTPVVFLTARNDAATIARAALIERTFYLLKSCSDEELHATLAAALPVAVVRTTRAPKQESGSRS